MVKKTMWDLFVEIKDLEEEIERLNFARNRRCQVNEKISLERQINDKLARMLEIKHKLQGIETLI